jgi:formylglycine-generating enzyme required for sulfatase activity
MKSAKGRLLIFSALSLFIATIIIFFIIETSSQVIETKDIIANNVSISYLENEWITINAGPYTFGNPAKTHNDIDYAYEIMKYEVTNNQYTEFLNTMLIEDKIKIESYVIGFYSGDTKQDSGWYQFFNFEDTLDTPIRLIDSVFFVVKGFEYHPVVEVSWFGANAYAEYHRISLPTEYEWEKAARGKLGKRYPWGEAPPNCDLATFINCSSKTTPIGATIGASPYGVYDMAGNVFEWTSSFWDNASAGYVIKGGSWSGLPSFMYTFNRYKYGFNNGLSGNNVGFRCIKRLKKAMSPA